MMVQKSGTNSEYKILSPKFSLEVHVCWGALQVAIAVIKAIAAIGGPNLELWLPIRSSNIYISCHSSG